MVWGESVIKELAAFLNQIKNFGEMKRFYETYREFAKLSLLVRDISWKTPCFRSQAKSIRREGILTLGITIEI